jgi:hypothetical protein
MLQVELLPFILGENIRLLVRGYGEKEYNFCKDSKIPLDNLDGEILIREGNLKETITEFCSMFSEQDFGDYPELYVQDFDTFTVALRPNSFRKLISLSDEAAYTIESTIKRSKIDISIVTIKI